MNVRDAVQLIAPPVLGGGRWADLGAGRGTFTAALARLLGPGGTVYAIERDATAIAALEMLARRGGSDGRSAIVVRHADFTQPMELPSLDGVLLANALHFVPDNEQARVLEHVARGVIRGGAIVVVEYDNRPPSFRLRRHNVRRADVAALAPINLISADAEEPSPNGSSSIHVGWSLQRAGARRAARRRGPRANAAVR